MSDVQKELKEFKKNHDFLIAIDSDGCAFDTMEIKHKECFIPNIIRYWQLQAVSKFTRAAAEFVNLYSRWRGINRFPALTMTFDLLKEWHDVQQRKASIPEAQSLRDWIARETKLGNPTLKKEVEASGDSVLRLALAWSEAVNRTVGEMVFGIPPFPFVQESLEQISRWADVLVCSATPNEALRREWEEHDLIQFTQVIAGQEMGSKTEHIALAAKGRFQPDNILMIGDALGDFKSAKTNGARFFPINPGQEEKSWERFFKEAAQKFKEGSYGGDYETELFTAFERLLPEIPPWEK
jgi:phosphoglycolate phosphatase-like HAD superfamily hydrolase